MLEHRNAMVAGLVTQDWFRHSDCSAFHSENVTNMWQLSFIRSTQLYGYICEAISTNSRLKHGVDGTAQGVKWGICSFSRIRMPLLLQSKSWKSSPQTFSADGCWRCMSQKIKVINTCSQGCPLHVILGSLFTSDCPQTSVHPMFRKTWNFTPKHV